MKIKKSIILEIEVLRACSTHRIHVILHEGLAPPPCETEWTSLSELLDFAFLISTDTLPETKNFQGPEEGSSRGEAPSNRRLISWSLIPKEQTLSSRRRRTFVMCSVGHSWK